MKLSSWSSVVVAWKRRNSSASCRILSVVLTKLEPSGSYYQATRDYSKCEVEFWLWISVWFLKWLSGCCFIFPPQASSWKERAKFIACLAQFPFEIQLLIIWTHYFSQLTDQVDFFHTCKTLWFIKPVEIEVNISVTDWQGGRAHVHLAAAKKMPAILVASKMKSGLPKPKPVHSAVPIPQAPSRPSVLALPPASLKTHIPSLGQHSTSQPQRSKAAEPQTGGSPQVRLWMGARHPAAGLCFTSQFYALQKSILVKN